MHDAVSQDIVELSMTNTAETIECKHTTLPTAKQVVDYSPAAIASYCGRGEQSGKDWKCNCPICGRHSLSITYGKTAPILIRCWHCKACGLNDGYTEQRQWLIDAGLLPVDARAIRRLSSEEREKHFKAKHEYAVRCWGHSVPIYPESIAAKYLKARGLESFITHPALRCLPPGQVAKHSPGRLRPVLISRLWHVNRGLCGVQFTYLEWDGSDRDRELEPGRRTYGIRKGAAVWIGAPQTDSEFVVAEALETLLSAMLVLGIRCGAAVLGPDLSELVLPNTATCVRIAADNDETGRGASEHAAKLWRGRGLKVRISIPDREGWDFNDVLLREGIPQ